MRKWLIRGAWGVAGALTGIVFGMYVLSVLYVEETVSYGCGYIAGMKSAGIMFKHETTPLCLAKDALAQRMGFNP